MFDWGREGRDRGYCTPSGPAFKAQLPRIGEDDSTNGKFPDRYRRDRANAALSGNEIFLLSSSRASKIDAGGGAVTPTLVVVDIPVVFALRHFTGLTVVAGIIERAML